MNINRNNYESFFLLYVDNELSAQQRTAVEEFVHHNPDLKKEFSLLIDTTLPAESISFPAKDSLVKTSIASPQEEDLLLHLDNEGGPSFNLAMQELIKGDPRVSAEWKILQQAKLDPSEQVIFTEKHLLYRKERENVFFIRYWKIAVAALFIGAGLYFSITLFNNTGAKKVSQDAVATIVKQPAADKTAPGNQANSKENAAKNTIPSNDIVPVKTNTDNAVAKTGTQRKASASAGEPNNKAKVNDPAIAAGNKGSVNSIAKKETNNLPVPYFENINNKASNQLVTQTVEYKKKALNDRNNSNDLAVVAPAVRPLNVIPASGDGPLTELNLNTPRIVAYNETDDNNDNRVLYMNEEKVNKSKLGGFFRKVKRVLVRNAKIKTGDGLRIGGFEIASK